jgi:hypothetical protein
MANTEEGPSVFISFATPNQTVAGMVCNALEQKQISCWVSWRNIPSGEDFPDRLHRAIMSCRVVVLIFSKVACQSPYIAREIQLAFENGKAVIPFRIENVKAEKSLGFHLAGVQWLDAFIGPIEDHLDKLVQQVACNLDHPISVEPPVAIAKPRARRSFLHTWRIALVFLLAILLTGAFATYFYSRSKLTTDESIHRALALQLHEAFDARSIAIDCPACLASQPHLSVLVNAGSVQLSGMVASQDCSAMRSMNLQLPGVKSIAYNVECLAQTAPASTPNTAPVGTTTQAQNPPAVHMKVPAAPSPAPISEDQLRATAFVLGGQKQFMLGNYVSAENQFQTARDLDPNNSKARSGLEAARKKLE